MISAFGVEHTVISKDAAISDSARNQRHAMLARGQKQSRAMGSIGTLGVIGAIGLRKPKTALGIAAGTPAAVVGNAALTGRKYKKLGQPGA